MGNGIKISYQYVGPLKLPELEGHDKLTHGIYGAVVAMLAMAVAWFASLTQDQSMTLVFCTVAVVAIGKEIYDLLQPENGLTRVFLFECVLDIVATLAGAVVVLLVVQALA